MSPEAIDDILRRIEDLLPGKEDKLPEGPEYPYSVRNQFLSPEEYSFFMVLKSVISDSVWISIKVGLGDLFYATSSDPDQHLIHTDQIERKHVDFLLCDSKTAQPLLGIELDDRSHPRSDGQPRDEFVEKVFQAARLPLLRIPVKQAYSPSELRALLKPHLTAGKKTVPSLQAVPPAPSCPRCGSDMVLRTAKSGTSPREKFWGCSKFPECRGMLKYSSLAKLIE